MDDSDEVDIGHVCHLVDLLDGLEVEHLADDFPVVLHLHYLAGVLKVDSVVVGDTRELLVGLLHSSVGHRVDVVFLQYVVEFEHCFVEEGPLDLRAFFVDEVYSHSQSGASGVVPSLL